MLSGDESYPTIFNTFSKTYPFSLVEFSYVSYVKVLIRKVRRLPVDFIEILRITSVLRYRAAGLPGIRTYHMA
jgi:hypothetical protein